MWERQLENSCKDLDVFLMLLGYIDGDGFIMLKRELSCTSVGQILSPDLPLNNLW